MDIPIKIAVINRGNQRVFHHDFGCIQGGNLVATGCNGNSGAIVANFGLKNEKNRQLLMVRTGWNADSMLSQFQLVVTK